MRYVGIALLSALVASMLIVTPIVVMAQELGQESDVKEPLEFTTAGGWGRLKVGFLLNMSFSEVLDLAYTIRNVTYSLFEWEIGYNITAANVTLLKADKFLERAVNLSDTQPKRANVYAFVAAVHYTHAPAFANSVLCRVLEASLSESDTITQDTVRTVLNLSQELRDLLEHAIEYAIASGYNVTLAKKLLDLGDDEVQRAESALGQGNVTEAFRHAVKGYRVYVRAYSALVKAVFAQSLSEKVDDRLTGRYIEYREPVVRLIIEELPVQVRERVRARVERGEIKSIREVVEEVERLAVQTREQVRLREKDNLKRALEKVMENIRVRIREREGREVQLPDNLSDIVEEYYKQGYRGTSLAKRVLEDLALKMRERNIAVDELPIPRPHARSTPPVPVPARK